MMRFFVLLWLISVSMVMAQKISVPFINVVDGDTLKVTYQGNLESVRLIGVDTMEISQSNHAYRQAKRHNVSLQTIIERGLRQSEWVSKQVAGLSTIVIEFDHTPRDRFGRLLGYVWLPSGQCLNEQLLRQPFVDPMWIEPNMKYYNLFMSKTNHKSQPTDGLGQTHILSWWERVWSQIKKEWQ